LGKAIYIPLGSTKGCSRDCNQGETVSSEMKDLARTII
jgi:hypothetical protein